MRIDISFIVRIILTLMEVFLLKLCHYVSNLLTVKNTERRPVVDLFSISRVIFYLIGEFNVL